MTDMHRYQEETLYITHRDAARRAQMSVTSLYERIKKGDGPRRIKIGGRVLYRPDDIDTWLTEHEEEAQPRAAPARVAEAGRVLAGVIKDRRLSARLSQQQLAAEMTAEGFPWYQSTVERTESAHRAVTWDEVVILAFILRFDLAEVVDAI